MMRKLSERSGHGPLCFLLTLFLALMTPLYLVYDASKLLRMPSPLTFLWQAAIGAALLALVWLLTTRWKPDGRGRKALVVFVLALALRLLFGLLHRCEPASDFAVYYRLGVDVASGEWSNAAALVAERHLNEFAGLAVINGLLARIFTPTVTGFAAAHALVTALIAVVVFVLGCEWDEDVGLPAGLLFAVYPANWVATQLMTNQHLAVLTTLLALWALLAALRREPPAKAAALAGLSGLLLVVSQYCHPSSLPTRIACICWLIGAAFAARRQRKALMRIGCAAAAFVLCLWLGTLGANAALERTGLLAPEQESTTVLSHVVVGLNPQTRGGYCAEDYQAIDALPRSEQNAACLDMIGERVRNVPQLLSTLAHKYLNMWVKTDNTFVFYENTLSADEQALQTGLTTLQIWDALFLTVIVALAALGLWVSRPKAGGAASLLLWVLLGWYGANMLNEAQSRYRYLAMPLLMVLAAVGAREAARWLRARTARKKQS